MKQFIIQNLIECLWEVKNIPIKVLERNIKKEISQKARKIMNGG